MSGSELILSATLRLDSFALDLDERIPLNGVTAVFGPSGSGKTSLLNVVAGFLRPHAGQISFADTPWFNASNWTWMPPHMRGVGVVFQDAQLFPHLSVQGNLDYARTRAPKDAPGHAYEDILSAMELGALLSRNVQSLSGGERQRVAIARTLLSRPRLLLLDEPLSALDNARKGELLPFLETLKSDFALPTLYVSHDVDEVSRIADRVMVMEDGRVIATGSTDDVLSRFGLEAGRNPYEEASFLTGHVAQAQNQDGLIAVQIGAAEIWLAADLHTAPGTAVRLKIPARDVSIALSRPTEISIQNMIPAKVRAIEPTKRQAFQSVLLDVEGQSLRATVTRKAVQDLALKPERKVFALIKSATFHH
jgi:molybdate transport system ATP-binding protein